MWVVCVSRRADGLRCLRCLPCAHRLFRHTLQVQVGELDAELRSKQSALADAKRDLAVTQANLSSTR